MDNKVENSSNMLDYFYSFCEASGDFWGNIHAKILILENILIQKLS